MTPSNFKDLSGQRFGMLAVKARAPSLRQKRGAVACWVCACDCGRETVVRGEVLRRGQYSCGCIKLRGRPTHSKSNSRVYRVWRDMIQRCTNPKVQGYPHYGGRGITVCARWRKFENFFADMGDVPAGHSIERREGDKGYEPDNCCWLPLNKQAQNRRGNIYVELGGERICVAEAARRRGILSSTIRYRLQHGWSADRALGLAP